MKNLSSWLILIAALTFACGGEEAEHDHDEADGHSHDGDAGGDGDEDHGSRHDLGPLDLGGTSVGFARYGDRVMGSDVPVDVVLPEGMEVTAVRVWYGSEGGVGSMKAKLDIEDGRHHGHVDLPSAAPVGSAWWVEVDGPDGTVRGTVADG